jgi:hypothetical protein
MVVGDEVIYFGTLGAYNGARQLASGADLIVKLSTGNTVTPNVFTAADMIALDGTDAGKLISFTGLEVKLYDGSHVTFTVTDGTNTRDIMIRYYGNFASWLPDVYPVGSTLPTVEFILYNFRSDIAQFDMLSIEPTDAQAVQLDADDLPVTLSLIDNYVLPDSLYGSTYTVIAVSTELDAFVDETTTPGTLLVTRPLGGQPDAVGTITIQVAKGLETQDVVINVTIVAKYDTSGETTYTQDFATLTTTTSSYSTSLQFTDGYGFAWDLLGRQNVGSWMLGNSADASFIQVTATGGIYSITFDVVRAFTNTNIRSGEVFVNGVSVGTFNVDTLSDVAQTISIEGINVTGDVIIKIVTTSPGSRGAYNVDNISWITYTPA